MKRKKLKTRALVWVDAAELRALRRVARAAGPVSVVFGKGGNPNAETRALLLADLKDALAALKKARR